MVMAISRCIAERACLAALALLALPCAPTAAAVASAPAATAATAAGRAATRTCESVNLDFKGKANFERSHQVVRDVTMTLTEADCRVSLTVKADVAEAGGRNFSNNDTWSVSGHVVMTMPEGELQADRAQVVLVGGVMTRATVNGSPATFAQAAPPGDAAAGSARGQAAVINYDGASGDLELLGDASGNARLQDDVRALNHQRIVYNLRQRSMVAGSNDPNSRGTITIKRPPKATP
jgi:lipopolysaccharide transport protein LptA